MLSLFLPMEFPDDFPLILVGIFILASLPCRPSDDPVPGFGMPLPPVGDVAVREDPELDPDGVVLPFLDADLLLPCEEAESLLLALARLESDFSRLLPGPLVFLAVVLVVLLTLVVEAVRLGIDDEADDALLEFGSSDGEVVGGACSAVTGTGSFLPLRPKPFLPSFRASFGLLVAGVDAPPVAPSGVAASRDVDLSVADDTRTGGGGGVPFLLLPPLPLLLSPLSLKSLNLSNIDLSFPVMPVDAEAEAGRDAGVLLAFLWLSSEDDPLGILLEFLSALAGRDGPKLRFPRTGMLRGFGEDERDGMPDWRLDSLPRCLPRLPGMRMKYI